MHRFIEALLKRVPIIHKLNCQIRSLDEQVACLDEQVRMLGEQVSKEGAYPAGHYYSPIPSQEDIFADINYRRPPSDELLGININIDVQYQLLLEYASFYKELPFPEEQASDCRYYYRNEWFGHADAIFLYSFLRKYVPKRIIEVGSGFSSTVMLDTIDHFYCDKPEVTFIEPFPNRLMDLLKVGDEDWVKVINKKVQEVQIDRFLALESGDLLFIDSSHVLKCGSDLQMLIFEILPQLKPGVFVHFHDVFYPFTYPCKWLHEGRYWNENYFLRAFLSYNKEWNIYFFNSYIHFKFYDIINEKMPLCTRQPGGSLYIKREEIN